MTDAKPPALFDWATELSDAQGHVTLSEQEAHEIGARLRRQHTENEALQAGYAAARLEIESLQDRIKTMAEEHADELMLAHLDGRMRAAQPVGAQQPAPSAAVAAEADTVVLEAALRAIHQAIDLIGEPDTERLRTVRRVLRGAVVVAEDCTAPQTESQPAEVRDYPPLPDFDTVEQHIYGACRRYITQDMLEPIHNLIRETVDADRAARTPADSVTAPAGAGVAHALSDAQIEAMPVWRNFVGLWPESRREIVDAVVDLLTTPPTQAADSVLEDAARLDWLLLHISGAEFRRIGVHYSGNAGRADVDAASKQGGV